ncbi:uncharacterized protein LOC134206100 [Armigeres subalbatus]|uniref:uncharacterized protein LOC134206100 n=1 Tax=Armigeres subalbatus TaxID=124917 RepID=UPI002ED44585
MAQIPVVRPKIVLGAEHIAAQQVMGKELPTFSGSPEDWPIFISCFEQSTTTCENSDAVNLIRLQRCSKGPVLEAVRNRLLLPPGVPSVIDTFRTLYGRPELLIRSLLRKIQHVAAPKHDRLESVMEFGLAVQNLVDHLEAAHQEDHLANPVLMQQLVEKLPGPLKLDWALFKKHYEKPTLRTFGLFMSQLVVAASEVTYDIPALYGAAKGERYKTREKVHIQTHAAESVPMPSVSPCPSSSNRKTNKPCTVCDREGHRVSDCFKFKSLNVDERWKTVQQKGLCRTCLNSHAQSTYTMFRVLPVVLYHKRQAVSVFAFIDEGSELTFLDESIAQQLGVTGVVEPLTLKWTGNSLRYQELAQIFPHLRGLPLQDHTLIQPKLLIGLDNLQLGVPLKLRQGRAGEPIAAKCRLGWGIYGGKQDAIHTESVANFHVAEVTDSDQLMNDQLRNFFTMENMGSEGTQEKLESEEDKRANRILSETTRRIAVGFETGLLWKTDYVELPDSYPMALRRLQSLEKKLLKQPEIKIRVQEQIAEYEQKGYAHRITDAELRTADPRRVWYLPLGIVLNPKKPGKK